MDNSINIKESELVLSPQGCLYHIGLTGETLADDIILVGDPERVEMFRDIFDTIEFESRNREMVALTGSAHGRRITALSTGMGCDNIDIVMTELDAAANIDLKTRCRRENHRRLRLVRIGTCGSLQADVECGTVVASRYVVGMDGLMNYYRYDESLFEQDMNEAFCRHMNFDNKLARPYSVQCSDELIARVGFDMRQVVTATAPGFYGPQGRNVALAPSIDRLNERLASFEWNGFKLTNLEMETSAIYGFARALGHEALTVCLVIANRPTGRFLNDYHDKMKALLEVVVSRF